MTLEAKELVENTRPGDRIKLLFQARDTTVELAGKLEVTEGGYVIQLGLFSLLRLGMPRWYMTPTELAGDRYLTAENLESKKSLN